MKGYAAVSIGFAVLCALTLNVPGAMAADTEFNLVIKDHRFEPQELTVPAGRKVKVWVDNQDKTPEEFESYDLNREKIIAGGKKVPIFIGPLKPGTYKYFGEFHQNTAQGLIIAKE